MNRWLPLLAFPALVAAAPTPMVVGTVVDQYGDPVSGARVTAGGAGARTDAQGTFALRVSGADAVAVSCDYCRPQRAVIAGDEPVVVQVRRYDALAGEAPTDEDLASIPYSHAESLAALRPFTVLENSSRLLPGAQVADRALTSRGSLFVADGIPIYDVATGQSPFATLPAYAIQNLTWRDPSDAFLYGDLAGGGTLEGSTQSSDPQSGVLAAGSASAARAGQTGENAAWSAALSHDPQNLRQLAAGSVRLSFGDEALGLSALSSRGDLLSGAGLQSANSGARLEFSSARETIVTAALTAQDGSYAGGTGYAARWSDVQVQAGVSTRTRIQVFAGGGARASSGFYFTPHGTIPDTAGAIAQTHLDAGVRTSGDRYSVQAGIGAFDIAYGGGALGSRAHLDGAALTPSLSASYDLDSNWSLHVDAGASFTQPTLLEALGGAPDTPNLPLGRNGFATATLRFGDLRRFRAAFTSASERVRGLDNGGVNSAGVSAEWQVTPQLALRAWVLHEDDTTQPYDALYRFGARPQPATVASYWLTYETAGMRVDAMYRRDLLDYRPDPHVDASISAPLGRGLRAFAQTERYAGVRVVSVGVHAATP